MTSQQSSLSNYSIPDLINHTKSKFRGQDFQVVKQELLNCDDRRQQTLNELMELRSKLEDDRREMTREMDELKERVLRVQEEKRLLEEEKRIMGERDKRGEEKREKLTEELRKKEEEVRVLERERGMKSEELNESLRGRLKELEKELEAVKSDRLEAKKCKKEDKNYEEKETIEEFKRKIRVFEHEKERRLSELKILKERCEKLKIGLANQKEGEKEKVKELEEKVKELKETKRERVNELKEKVKELEKDKDEAEKGLGVCKSTIREVKQENKEKCDKLMEGLRKQEEGERERTRILADRVRDLESGKVAAEGELEYWKVKFRELDSRVLQVQEEMKVLLTFAESMPKEDLHKSNGPSGICACESGGNVNYNQGNAVCSNENAHAQEAVERKPDVSEKESRREYKSGNSEAVAGSDNCSSSANVFQVNETKHVEQEVGGFAENCFVEKEVDLKPDVIHISDGDDDNDEITLVRADEILSTRKRKRSLISIETDEDDSTSGSEDTKDISVLDIDSDLHNKWSRWDKEQDMVLQFETDKKLCMRAVCVLYREEILQSASCSDAIRGLALAHFLTDGNTDGRMRKKIEDLKAKDEKGVDDCRRIAMSFSKQLFEIQENKSYPFFYIF